jgi:hypothetical protein
VDPRAADYANPFPLSSEGITEGLTNPFVEYESLLHDMQALKGQVGLLGLWVRNVFDQTQV